MSLWDLKTNDLSRLRIIIIPLLKAGRCSLCFPVLLIEIEKPGWAILKITIDKCWFSVFGLADGILSALFRDLRVLRLTKMFCVSFCSFWSPFIDWSQCLVTNKYKSWLLNRNLAALYFTDAYFLSIHIASTLNPKDFGMTLRSVAWKGECAST